MKSTDRAMGTTAIAKTTHRSPDGCGRRWQNKKLLFLDFGAARLSLVGAQLEEMQVSSCKVAFNDSRRHIISFSLTVVVYMHACCTCRQS